MICRNWTTLLRLSGYAPMMPRQPSCEYEWNFVRLFIKNQEDQKSWNAEMYTAIKSIWLLAFNLDGLVHFWTIYLWHTEPCKQRHLSSLPWCVLNPMVRSLARTLPCTRRRPGPGSSCPHTRSSSMLQPGLLGSYHLWTVLHTGQRSEDLCSYWLDPTYLDLLLADVRLRQSRPKQTLYRHWQLKILFIIYYGDMVTTKYMSFFAHPYLD